jgi:hypothetical protein
MGAYRERLLVPVAYWLLAVPVVLTLGAQAWFVAGGIVPPLVITALAVLAVTFLGHWSRATIEVDGGVLRAGSDALALSAVAEVVALDERQASALRGPRADPAAHILLRPYLKFAVYIGLADPASGVPYWLVATRHPAELAAAIEEARRLSGAAGTKPGGPQPDSRESVG